MKSKIIKSNSFDTEQKEMDYLKKCLELSYEERIARLEELRERAFEIFLANPDNHLLIELSEEDKKRPPRLRRLRKFLREIKSNDR